MSGIQHKKSDEAKRLESIRRNGGRHIQTFKEENITYEMCLIAVEMDGSAIYFVPECLRTEELYRVACKSYGLILGKVPKEYVSKEMCESAASSDIRALEDVPDEYKTHDFFLAVARKNPAVMQKMPEEYLTADFCIDVIKHYGNKAISSIFSISISSLIFLHGWLRLMIVCMRHWMLLASNTGDSIHRYGNDCLLFQAYI